MQRDQLIARPRLAGSLLMLGAAVHFVLCWPLFGRRGYPEVDPFWWAMAWLWIPPVAISAVFVPLDRRRWRDLALYALAVGFIISYGTVLVVPSFRGPLPAAIEVFFYGPVAFVGIGLVELFSRALLARLRRFRPKAGVCETCGYSLFGLPEPRCPECGTPFDPQLLEPGYEPAVTPVGRRWTTWLILLICLVAAIFPFAYREWSFYSARSSGQHCAERDWAAGSPVWYITDSELEQQMAALPDDQPSALFSQLGERNPATGWRIMRIRDDWRRRHFGESYRRTIERLLKASGRQPTPLRPFATGPATQAAGAGSLRTGTTEASQESDSE